VVGVLGARFFLLIAKYSVNLFWWDQWDYFASFFRGDPGIVELFTLQVGPHREGVGLILDRFLYPLTHWDTRVDAYIIGTCIFGAMLLAFQLKRRLFGSITYFDVAIPLLFLPLAQYETLLGTPNPSYAGFPLLMIMLYCYALLNANPYLKISLLLLLNFLLIYTGFGLFMGVVTVGIFAIECYRCMRRSTNTPPVLALTGLVVAAASLGSFFMHYHFSPAVDCFEFPHHPIRDYPSFVAIMFSRFIIGGQGLLFAMVVGIPIAIAAMSLAGFHFSRGLTHNSAATPHWIPLVLLSYSLLFSADCAIGRVCLGLPKAAQSSRYVTLMIPAFLAMYFWIVSLSASIRRTAVSLLFIVLLMPAALLTPRGARRSTDTKQAWSECYLRNHNIEYCDQIAGFSIYPENGPNRSALTRKLEFLQERNLNFFFNSRQDSSK
jgi:hypothetical protein